MPDQTFEKVKKTLDQIRPMLQADGGSVDLISVENGTVKVKLQGACGSCPMSQMTLKMGIERQIKKDVPEIKEVVSV
jgi:Fe-S cluster biogenesis protein NfuA